MINLVSILKEIEDSILVPRRSKEERVKNHVVAVQKQIKQYVVKGSKGNLRLTNTPIKNLPQELRYVEGDLDLRKTSLDSLPQNLKIGDSLYLNSTPIKNLPQGLEVGGDLNINNTLINSLPKDMTVKGDLWAYYTPLSANYTEEQVRGMCPEIEGDVYL
jgi:hypothetical protein